MPRRMNVDFKQLLAMVQGGIHQSEIMATFGFKTATQLKLALANAAMAEGKLPSLVGGGKVSAAKPGNAIRVNKRGSLVVPRHLVEAFGFSVGDQFLVRQVEYGVQLRKLGFEPDTEE